MRDRTATGDADPASRAGDPTNEGRDDRVENLVSRAVQAAQRVGPFVLVAGVVALLYGVWITDHALLTHEGTDPYSRTAQLVIEVDNGNIPPQLLPDARGGSGSAFGRYYPPIPFGVATAIAMATDDVVLGVNLAFVAAAAGSAITMAWAARRLGGDRALVTGAAIVYLALPYHLFDVHVRGALGESFAFVFLPLLVVGMWTAGLDGRWSGAAVVGVAGLLLSHTISGVIAVVFVALVAGRALYVRSRAGVVAVVVSGALGLALSAWFLLPQQLELSDVWVSDQRHMLATDDAVVGHAVPAGDLIGSWRNGFRGYDDPPYLADVGQDCWLYFCGGENFALGPVTLALPFVAATLLLRRRRTKPLPVERTHERSIAAAALASTLVGATIVWLGFVVVPRPLMWLAPGPAGYVQFPWRALAPIGVATTLLWVLLLRDRRHGGTALVLIGIAAALLVPAAQREPWVRADIVDACFTAADVRDSADPVAPGCFVAGDLGFVPPADGGTDSRRGRGARGFTTGNDYLPVSADEFDPQLGVPSAPTVDSDGEVLTWHRTGDGLQATVRSAAAATVRLPVSRYRFTRVRSDREEAEVLAAEASNGIVVVAVPSGTTTITVDRTRTGAELAAVAVSVTAGALLGAAAYRRRRPGKRARVTREVHQSRQSS